MFQAKKHKRILSREIHYWTRIWSGRGDGLRAGTEKWEDGNTNNGDGSKGKCPDCFLTKSIHLAAWNYLLIINSDNFNKINR